MLRFSNARTIGRPLFRRPRIFAPHIVSTLVVLMSVTTLVCQASGRPTDGAEVIFDTAAVQSCRDVSTPEFLRANPGDRLLEMEIEVSSLHRDANRDDIEYLVQVYSPDRSIYVADYEPKTMVQPTFDGNINVETTREGSANIGIDAGGAFESIVKLGGHASAGGKTVETERYQRLAPHELLLAAGLMHRGAGVYYKIRSSPHLSMEGGRRFTIRFRVSEDWRCGLLRVACVARSDARHPLNPLDTRGSVGGSRFVVASYLEGDQLAKECAEAYAQREFALRQISARLHDAIDDHSGASMIGRVGQSLGLVDPKVPEDWLARLLCGQSDEWQTFREYLPHEIQVAGDDWLRSVREIETINSAPRSTGVFVQIDGP